MELLGDATMLTVKAGGAIVSAKAHKEYRARIGDPVGIRVSPVICHLFDKDTGQRLGTH
jgi:multiple sugar transport system ATP-binding protein